MIDSGAVRASLIVSEREGTDTTMIVEWRIGRERVCARRNEWLPRYHAGAVACRGGLQNRMQKRWPYSQRNFFGGFFLLTVHDCKRWMKQCEGLGSCNTNAFFKLLITTYAFTQSC